MPLGDTTNWEFAAAVAAVSMGLGGLLLFTMIGTIGSWRVFDRVQPRRQRGRQGQPRGAGSRPLPLDSRETMRAAPVVDRRAPIDFADLRQPGRRARSTSRRACRTPSATSSRPACSAARTPAAHLGELESSVKRLEEHLSAVAAAVANLAQQARLRSHATQAKNAAATAPRRRAPRPSADDVSSALAALLPVHSALTLDRLADAAATAAEGTLDAAYTFVYLEDQDGRLERKAPASDIRRRSLQRAIDAFGEQVIAAHSTRPTRPPSPTRSTPAVRRPHPRTSSSAASRPRPPPAPREDALGVAGCVDRAARESPANASARCSCSPSRQPPAEHVRALRRARRLRRRQPAPVAGRARAGRYRHRPLRLRRAQAGVRPPEGAGARSPVQARRLHRRRRGHEPAPAAREVRPLPHGAPAPAPRRRARRRTRATSTSSAPTRRAATR